MAMMGSGDGAAPTPEARPLRVLLALPRPLIALHNTSGGAPVPLSLWDSAAGVYEPLPLQRVWDLDSVEAALQVSGAPMAVRTLYHATREDLARAARAGYDVVIIDTYGTDDGTFYLEGRCGESHPISAADLGSMFGHGDVKVAILSACYSPTACRLLHAAGVPAVVGMTEAVREDAARVYLEVFLDQLARGYSIEEAGDQACAVLRQRWSTRLDEGELPRIVARKSVCLGRLVRAGLQGDYTRIADTRSSEPRPPAVNVRLRGRELDQVLVHRGLISTPSSRGDSPAVHGSLVTLHGFGGIGKSALALSVASWCWERAIFADGVRVVRLSAPWSGSGQSLADSLVRALDMSVPEEAGRGAAPDSTAQYRAKVDALLGALQGKQCLLLIDDFGPGEHEGGKRDLALVSQLRKGCPNLSLMFTGPSPLGLVGERLYELEPLTVDAAVEIFRDRARDARKMLLHAERPIVAEICELLDCIPLHIRLVATHIRAERSPTAILEQLRRTGRRLSDECDDSSSEGQYQLSQQISFQYAYDHLGEHGRRLWAVMAGVFAGAPGRADVRAVYAHFSADQALDGLLLWSVVTSLGGRHHMAGCLREFGRRQLAEGVLEEEETAYRDRHAAHYLAYAREHKGDSNALERERADILAAYRYACAGGRETEMAVAFRNVLRGIGQP